MTKTMQEETHTPATTGFIVYLTFLNFHYLQILKKKKTKTKS